MRKNYFKKQFGMTVIEILVVIAVLSIIFSIVIPQFSKMRENQVLKSGVQDVLSSLNKAHSQTLASLNSSVYGVHFQADKIVIFKNNTFSPDAIDNETINIITPATISSVALGCTPTIPCDIYFNRLSGSPSMTGTITISTASYFKVITISAAGVASSN